MASPRDKKRKERQKSSAKSWAADQGKGFEPTAVRTKLKIYKLEEGIHEIDIIPFLAGADNPRADEGFEHFEHEYDVHRIPNQSGNFDRIVCTAVDPYRERCEPCRARPDFKEGDNDPLRPQKRHLFLVNDKPGDPKNELKILDAVHYNRKLGFGEQLVLALNASDDGDNFSDLQEGCKLRITVEDSKYGSVSRIDLVPRKYAYPESMLKPESDYWEIIKPDRDEVLRLLGLADAHHEGNGQETPKAKASAKAPPPDDEDDVEDEDTKEEEENEENEEPVASDYGIELGSKVSHDDFGECLVTKVSGDGTSLTLEDEDGEIHRGIGPDEVQLVKKTKKDGKKPSRKEPEPEEGDDEWEEEDTEEDEDNTEEDEEEEETEDDDDGEWEEEEEPPAKKPAQRKTPAKAPDKKGGKKPNKK